MDDCWLRANFTTGLVGESHSVDVWKWNRRLPYDCNNYTLTSPVIPSDFFQSPVWNTCEILCSLNLSLLDEVSQFLMLRINYQNWRSQNCVVSGWLSLTASSSAFYFPFSLKRRHNKIFTHPPLHVCGMYTCVCMFACVWRQADIGYLPQLLSTLATEARFLTWTQSLPI